MILLPFLRPAAVVAVLAFSAVPAFAQTQQRPSQAQPNAQTPSARQAQPKPGAITPAKPATASPAATNSKQGTPKPGASGPAGTQAVLVASFGDWAVYAAQAGRAKICYALSQPKDRQPKTLNRDPGYLFVSFRPAENVRNEVALVMGFPTKEDGPAEASVGKATYALLTKEQNAWLKNPAEEGQLINAMTRGQSLDVKVRSQRGNASSDRYSLNGFGQALERARKECP